ncbi:unnamed protein product [Callosobruchus maculatus]|uniref:Uncharacterized protein n=1 Tax=Callosobruchus maculatus TaxID=64391 RepID=A0A653DIZ3_CALMS|nr:unnamed protein product [Callosobruchus maculatus]
MQDRAERYGHRMTFKTPLLPEARLEWETENSWLYNKVQQTEYPPIFARQSWTKGVLEKDMQMYFKPSETIGATFTPGAQNLRIQDMTRHKRKKVGPLGENGVLCYPPKKTKKQIEEEQKKEQERQNRLKVTNEGFVDIEDLLSGAYHRRRQEQKETQKSVTKMIKKVNLLKWEGFPDESE